MTSSVQSPSYDMAGKIAAPQSADAAKKTDQSGVAADQDKFLTLLVTQLKNQDPLNPLDNAQITSQLAQLSTVSGINQLNATVSALMGSYQNSETLQAAGMISHGVLAPGNTTTLVKGQAVFGVELGTAADKVTVTIFNESGKAVRTLDLDKQNVGTVPVSWDGKDDEGKVLADGGYYFNVKASQGGTELKDATALALGVVSSVSRGPDGILLNVSGIGTIGMKDVRQIL